MGATWPYWLLHPATFQVEVDENARTIDLGIDVTEDGLGVQT
jgi:hypothetical protein